jgi:hypothetical protein
MTSSLVQMPEIVMKHFKQQECILLSLVTPLIISIEVTLISDKGDML